MEKNTLDEGYAIACLVANHPGIPGQSRDFTHFESLSRGPGKTLFCPGIFHSQHVYSMMYIELALIANFPSMSLKKIVLITFG